MMQLQQTNPQDFQIRFDNAVATAAAEITEELSSRGEMAAQKKEDPLVRIKQQEIDLRAMDLTKKSSRNKI